METIQGPDRVQEDKWWLEKARPQQIDPTIGDLYPWWIPCSKERRIKFVPTKYRPELYDTSRTRFIKCKLAWEHDAEEREFEDPFCLDNLRIIDPEEVKRARDRILRESKEHPHKPIVIFVGHGGTISMSKKSGENKPEFSPEELLEKLVPDRKDDFVYASFSMPTKIDSSQNEIDYAADIAIATSWLYREFVNEDEQRQSNSVTIFKNFIDDINQLLNQKIRALTKIFMDFLNKQKELNQTPSGQAFIDFLCKTLKLSLDTTTSKTIQQQFQDMWHNLSGIGILYRFGGFVICHGTDTLCQANGYLAAMLGSNCPFNYYSVAAQKTPEYKKNNGDAGPNFRIALRAIEEISFLAADEKQRQENEIGDNVGDNKFRKRFLNGVHGLCTGGGSGENAGIYDELTSEKISDREVRILKDHNPNGLLWSLRCFGDNPSSRNLTFYEALQNSTKMDLYKILEEIESCLTILKSISVDKYDFGPTIDFFRTTKEELQTAIDHNRLHSIQFLFQKIQKALQKLIAVIVTNIKIFNNDILPRLQSMIPSLEAVSKIYAESFFLPIILRGHSVVMSRRLQYGDDFKELQRDAASSKKKAIVLTTFGSYTAKRDLVDATMNGIKENPNHPIVFATNPFPDGTHEHDYPDTKYLTLCGIVPLKMLDHAAAAKLAIAFKLFGDNPKNRMKIITFMIENHYVGEQLVPPTPNEYEKKADERSLYFAEDNLDRILILGLNDPELMQPIQDMRSAVQKCLASDIDRCLQDRNVQSQLQKDGVPLPNTAEIQQAISEIMEKRFISSIIGEAIKLGQTDHKIVSLVDNFQALLSNPLTEQGGITTQDIGTKIKELSAIMPGTARHKKYIVDQLRMILRSSIFPTMIDLREEIFPDNVQLPDLTISEIDLRKVIHIMLITRYILKFLREDCIIPPIGQPLLMRVS